MMTKSSQIVPAIAGKRVLILGMGASGYAAAELALRFGANVTVLDEAGGEGLQERAASLRERGVDVFLEWNSAEYRDRADEIVISPGISRDSVLGRLAASASAPVIGEIEFAFRFCACPVIAVTGTNGKTTTVEMTTHALQRTGYKVRAAGNIGPPFSQAVLRSAGLDFVVLEVSSFQLERVERFAPLAAALLNLSPDHFDRHADFAEYTACKLRIFERMVAGQRAVLSAGVAANESIRTCIERRGLRTIVFARSDRSGASRAVESAGTYLSWDRKTDEVILTEHGAPSRIPAGFRRLFERGVHNVDNALAALALCRAVGAAAEPCAAALGQFSPGRHRMEPVAVENGVRYIDDSKSTNPDALRSALETLEEQGTAGNVLLIAGGLSKNLDFRELRPLLRRVVREVFLIGSCRKALAKQWFDVVSCQWFSSLEAAVAAAVESARPGDTVLLSPGCSSLDMFRDYAERGERFCELVTRRTGE